MRNFWHQIPLVRVAMALIAGIWVAIYASHQLLPFAVVLAGMAFAFVVGYSFLNITQQYKLRVWHGVGLWLFVAASGYIVTWLHTAANHPCYYGKHMHGRYVVTIAEPPVEREKTINAIADVEQTGNTNTCGKLLLNFVKNDLSRQIKYGDVLVLNARMQPFKGPQNPSEFDYRFYQRMHNINYRAYVVAGMYNVIKHNQGSRFFNAIYGLRESFLHILQKYVHDKNDFGVASAMMLGYRDYLNDDIIHAYSSSGIIHVLSVSGLHVGIMFLMLNLVLGWLDKQGTKAAVAKTVFIIVFIWFYACLTGLSPAVLRSAAMFSMVQLGMALARHVSMYNVLAGTACLLLLVNPFLIADIGFLLSYIAVLGIVYLHPRLASLWLIAGPKPKCKDVVWYLKPYYFLRYDLYWFIRYALPDFIWQLTAVSIVAQVVTLPLSIYYFHQFPNLFLIANVIIIPVSNVLLFLGTGLFIFQAVPYFSNFLGWCFSGLLRVMDLFIFWIDTIPFALWKGLGITRAEMLLLYVVIFLVCWYFYEKRTKVAITALVLVSLLSIYNAYEAVQQAQQRRLVVYSVPKQSAVSFISGNTVSTCFDSTLLTDRRNMDYHVRPHWCMCGVGAEAKAKTVQFSFGKLMEFEGKKIVIVEGGVNYMPATKLAVNKIIICHNATVTINQLRQLFHFNEIIFDSSNKPKQVAVWIADCKSQNIKYWDVNASGAYIADLRN